MSDNQTAGSPLPTPNYEESVRFLELLHRPDDTWHLQAIHPLSGNIVGCALPPGPRRGEQVLAWLTKHGMPKQTPQGPLGYNFYYHPNPIRAGAKLRAGKASKTDIAEVCYLMVDCDPRVGEDVGSEQLRLRAVFAKEEVRPTFLVASGNGIQALYRLRKPIPLPLATEKEADHVALYNLSLAARLDGDRSCRDISHVMRIPGTVNWPNAAKRKKGRVPALAALLEHNDGAHDQSAFPVDPEQAVPAGTGAPPGKTPAESVDSTLVARAIASIDHLPNTVPLALRHIIQHGHNPDAPARFGGDRSKAVWHVTCELLRQKVAPEIVLGVLLAPHFGISAHVLDQPRSDKYARRQIARGQAAVEAAKAEFVCNKEGQPYPIAHNVRVAIAKLGVLVEHDVFADRPLVHGLDGFGPDLSAQVIHGNGLDGLELPDRRPISVVSRRGNTGALLPSRRAPRSPNGRLGGATRPWARRAC